MDRAQDIIIAGIDPGLASGGFVLLRLGSDSREELLLAASLSESKNQAADERTRAFDICAGMDGWSDVSFLTADLRAKAWVERFTDIFNDAQSEFGEINYVAVESFIDQAQHAKKMRKLRWTTPLVIGRLAARLDELGFSSETGKVVWQDAGVVLRQQADELARLASNKNKAGDVLITGDHLLTNSHQRAAFAHARALSLRIKHLNPQSQEITA